MNSMSMEVKVLRDLSGIRVKSEFAGSSVVWVRTLPTSIRFGLADGRRFEGVHQELASMDFVQEVS